MGVFNNYVNVIKGAADNPNPLQNYNKFQFQYPDAYQFGEV